MDKVSVADPLGKNQITLKQLALLFTSSHANTFCQICSGKALKGE